MCYFWDITLTSAFCNKKMLSKPKTCEISYIVKKKLLGLNFGLMACFVWQN